MSVPPLYIDRIGMACPVGLTMAASCAAMRAGVDRKIELPYLDNAGGVIKGSVLTQLGDGIGAKQRWLKLLRLAIRDALRESSVVLQDLQVLVSIPVCSAGEAAPLREIAGELSAEAKTTIHLRQIRVRSDGAYGSYQDLAHARELLLTRRSEAVLVCAADSLVTAPVLLALSTHRRLLTEDNADGVIPGEAAACVLLTGARSGALGAILGMGFAEEPALPTNDVPLRAEGLAGAARIALKEAGLAMHEVDYRLSDAAGESYHFKEQALVVAKLLRSRKLEFPLWLGASALGYVGAAAGLCNVAWALHCYRRGSAPGRHAIAWAGQDGHGRSALILEGHPAPQA